jgi:hypothetical protein
MLAAELMRELIELDPKVKDKSKARNVWLRLLINQSSSDTPVIGNPRSVETPHSGFV